MRLLFTTFSSILCILLASVTPLPAAGAEGLQSGGASDTKRLSEALHHFPDAMTLRPDWPQAQQWSLAFEALDHTYGFTKGTCAVELPRFSRLVLSVKRADPRLTAAALLVLGRIDEAEKLALQMAESSISASLSASGWRIASEIAVKKGDTELALTRIRQAAARTDPDQSFNTWAVMQSALGDALRRTGRKEEQIKVLRKLHERCAEKNGVFAGLTLSYHNELANALYEQSRFAEAEKEFKAMLAALAERPEKDVMQVQVIRDNLAKSIAAQGRKEEAEALDVSVVTIRKKTVETEATLDQRGQLGAQLYRQRRYAEAAEQWRIVYEEWKQRGGPEHEETLIAQNDLAVALKELGRNEESAALLMEVIKIKLKHLPADDVTILESRNNLANALSGMGSHEAAAREHRTVAEARRRILGPKHTKTLDAYQNLAGDLEEIDQLEEAEKLAREVVAAREAEGADAVKMLSSCKVLFSILSRAGKSEEAEKGYRSLVESSERKFGADHPETLTVRHSLAVFLSDEGRRDESRKICLANVEKCRKVLGREHPLTEKAEILLNKLSLGPNEPGQTVSTNSSRSLLAKNLNEFGPDHPKTVQARTLLAHQLQRQNQNADAAKEYEMAVSVYRRLGQLQTEEALDARNGQALNLRELGRLNEAEASFRPLLQECISVLGEEHAISVACLGNLALTLRSQKKFEEALGLQKELLMRQASLHKEGHPKVITAYIQFAGTLRELGRTEEWRVYVQRAYDMSKRTLGEQDPMTRSIKAVLDNPSILDEPAKDAGAGGDKVR